MFEERKKKFQRTEGLPGPTLAWSVEEMGKRNRKDLRKLYGMEEVSEDVYNTIMRADSGDASDADYRILEQYMKEKKMEIRAVKERLGLEGGGRTRLPGKAAENVLVNLYKLTEYTLDKEDDDD